MTFDDNTQYQIETKMNHLLKAKLRSAFSGEFRLEESSETLTKTTYYTEGVTEHQKTEWRPNVKTHSIEAESPPGKPDWSFKYGLSFDLNEWEGVLAITESLTIKTIFKLTAICLITGLLLASLLYGFVFPAGQTTKGFIVLSLFIALVVSFIVFSRASKKKSSSSEGKMALAGILTEISDALDQSINESGLKQSGFYAKRTMEYDNYYTYKLQQSSEE